MDTLYGLSFEMRGEKPVPTLIVTTKLGIYNEVGHFFKKISLRNLDEDFDQYVGKKNNHFCTEEHEFGFGKCGSIEKNDTLVRFYFPISRKLRASTIATLHEVFIVLNYLRDNKNLFDDIISGKQLFTLESGYGMLRGFHTHPITGRVSNLFKKWLVAYFEAHDKHITYPKTEVVMVPQQVEKAMQITWKISSGTIASGKAMDGVGGCIYGDERFFLVCPGNACDVAIYPDNDRHIGCHNLDTQDQQLTLLAGLFSLFEFIQKHPDAKSAP